MKNNEYQQKLIAYVNEQVAQGDARARAYAFDVQGNKNPTRNAYVKLNMHLTNYFNGKRQVRWILFPGLRGAGKTTLLSQLYLEINPAKAYNLFLSLDDVTRVLTSNLSDVLSVYEEIIGKSFENLDKPLILFLDEVQYDDNWAITLKTIYDRSPNVFIFATGSSALALNHNNPDVARRAIFEKLFPMCFSEYMKIKEGKYEVKGLSVALRKAIFNSSNAAEAYKEIQKLETSINRYWYGIERLEISRYLEYSSLPYMVKLGSEALVYDQIAQTIDKIITKDIPQVGQVTNEVLSKVPSLLYAVSESDTLNVKKLSEIMDIGRPTLSNLLEVIEKTELLYRVYPYGSHFSQVKKPSKYLFASSAFRSMYFHSIGNITKEQNYKGHLMEDVFIGYCKRIFWGRPGVSITYDAAQGGADFIIGIGADNIVCEVGYGKKDYRQLITTMNKVKSRYGICISSNELELREDINAISIPLKYFLLA